MRASATDAPRCAAEREKLAVLPPSSASAASSLNVCGSKPRMGLAAVMCPRILSRSFGHWASSACACSYSSGSWSLAGA